MSAAANEYGNCYLGVHARFIGVQPVQVQGVAAAVSRSGHEHTAVMFGRALFYLEDRAAFESFRAAFQRAERLADRVLGPVQDAFTEAEQREADWIARTGGVKPGTPKPLPPRKSAARSSCTIRAWTPIPSPAGSASTRARSHASSTAPRRNRRWVRSPAGDRTHPRKGIVDRDGRLSLVGLGGVHRVGSAGRAVRGTPCGKVGSPGAVVARPHTGSVTNPTGNWALENLPAFEELYAAMEQLSLEAGVAGDSVKETGSLEEAAPSVDIARERVAHAAVTVRECSPPPDAESARHLAAALDALDEFRTAKRFDGWVQAWTRATEHRDAFTRAFAIADGQHLAGS